jgi:hypothetical protein
MGDGEDALVETVKVVAGGGGKMVVALKKVVGELKKESGEAEAVVSEIVAGSLVSRRFIKPQFRNVRGTVVCFEALA